VFVDVATARRLERAEAGVSGAVAGALVGTARAPDAFLRELGTGVAGFVRGASPMNKVIGVGIDGPVPEPELGAVEAMYEERSEPVRVELATLADPRTLAQLVGRGYRLLGFENVLVRALADAPRVRDDVVAVHTVTEATLPVFRDTVVEGFAAPDDTGVVVDQLTREMIEAVIDDSLAASGFRRYLALREGALAGAASMRLHDGVAVLTGSATLRAHRRKGVQAELLARRLGDACAAGAELAIITTAPGTQSQANTMKAGFALGYARAILVRAFDSAPPAAELRSD
jgi:hypothetical protein